MKKIFNILLILGIFITLVGCKNNEEVDDGIYTINFYVNSNNQYIETKKLEKNTSITLDYINSTVLLNETPSKIGYNYTSEWYLDDSYNSMCFFPITVTKDMNLYLKWERVIQNYDINYYVDDEIYYQTTEKDNILPTKPADPVKKYYTFDGWYTDEKYTNKFDFLSYFTSNTNLYAKFIRDDFEFNDLSNEVKQNLSVGGYVYNNITDFSQYVGTTSYRTVSTADELISALADAKYQYTNTWIYDPRTEDEQVITDRLAFLDSKNKTEGLTTDEKTERVSLEAQALELEIPGHIEQTLTQAGTVHVIEITKDINLGYYTLSDTAKAQTSIVEDFCKKNANQISSFTMSKMFTENGISQIKVENTSNLLIYSKKGAKLTHGGFKLTSDYNVVFRNLEFDEMWQWEDTSNKAIGAVGDYDAFGWAYFKISFSENIWIDHCTFGKSYDGQIDYSNPFYNNKSTSFRAPYGGTGGNGLHISWCEFNAGSDNKNGYLYQMMAEIEQEYQDGKENYLYYNVLRKNGITFEEILYGLAIPQKKGFLLGDSGDEYEYNLKLNVSMANCYFKNLEDRLPKLRGGNVYMYNCVVDSLEYYEYRAKLQSKAAASWVTLVNGTWKCALVSQGILCGLGGSIKAENCIFRGIEYLLKNNDSGSSPNVDGNYELINCIYQKSKDSTIITSDFPNSSESKLFTNFTWHTADGLAPFSITTLSLDDIENHLDNINYGAGITDALEDKWIQFNYCE